MTNFTTKNDNRKAFHKGNVKARQERRDVAGAFGNEDKETFNRLAVGTSGDPR